MNYDACLADLRQNPRTWLVTGVAGFIGSNLLQTLLENGQTVVGLDDFATGHKHNLETVRNEAGPEAAARFTFHEGSIRNFDDCLKACQGVDIILHQAAYGSVPRSIERPLFYHENNATGFVNMLEAARQSGIKRFVYASSSSVYGDSPVLPKQEDNIGKPLSPYALTKLSNEHYADVYGRVYGLECMGLRYFNIFGRRQDPNGAYAAVIPLWFKNCIHNEPVYINGDGETSRDFCYIDNVMQANIQCGITTNQDAANTVYNIACEERTTLNELFTIIRDLVAQRYPHAKDIEPTYRDFRPGDVRHSLANIDRAKSLLDYDVLAKVRDGLVKTADWYMEALG